MNQATGHQEQAAIRLRRPGAVAVSTMLAIFFGLSNVVAPPVATAGTCAYAPEAPPICDASIFGMVTWPDGEPAGNRRIELVPNTRGVLPGTFATYDGGTVQVHTDPAGRCEARVCPCDALMGFLEVGDGVNCQIVMGALTSSTTEPRLSSQLAYNGVHVEPGESVVWIIGRTTCRIQADTATPGSITQAWLDAGDPQQAQPLSWFAIRDREFGRANLE